MNKFDIQPERATAEARERYLNRPTLSILLTAQAAPLKQSPLFACSPLAESAPPSCDHVGTPRMPQRRFDGGTDYLCTCGAVVDAPPDTRAVGEHCEECGESLHSPTCHDCGSLLCADCCAAVASDRCPECARSRGPHYSGPCEH